jgi:xeroderma pigmentosum group C-complementing protein
MRQCRSVREEEIDKPVKKLKRATPGGLHSRRGGGGGGGGKSSPGNHGGGDKEDQDGSENNEEEEDEEIDEGIPIYGMWQTDAWEPPPVTTEGKLPRNNHGNWEVWTERHIPKGATHLGGGVGLLLIKAAKHLKVDYVRAVVGFRRDSGNVVPDWDGILVAEIVADMVVQTTVQLAAMEKKEKARKKRRQVELRWATFVRRLQTRAHVANQFKGSMHSSMHSGSKSANVEIM